MLCGYALKSVRLLSTRANKNQKEKAECTTKTRKHEMTYHFLSSCISNLLIAIRNNGRLDARAKLQYTQAENIEFLNFVSFVFCGYALKSVRGLF